ncbi:unnamed protein product [Mycena citricolor]|uniref:Alpha-amylase n=1 Tax=Mycena citricolor TaxID=2018698 RepID=A0AAD2H1M9_9AGAR|nr:unnamed protein product [Mycena citricolor]
MRSAWLKALHSLIFLPLVFAASAEEWSSRSIYQIVTDRFALSTNSSAPCDTSKRTYCGGTWAGVTNHLDYIQGMGFDALWISPVVENMDGTAYGDGYHGYWTQDLNTISPHFGTSDDLHSLINAVHARGMYIMFDVVVNHFASVPTNTTPGFTFDYSKLAPFNNQAQYHPLCFISDYTNQTNVEQCWLGDAALPLPDINTEDSNVVTTLNTWIKNLVSTYNIDGLRIDTVKHIRRDFWPSFCSNAGVFTLGEVLSDDPNFVAPYMSSVDAVLDYPTWYNLRSAFVNTTGNLSALTNSPSLYRLSNSSTTSPVRTAAFLENHDQARFASSTSDISLTKNAMAWPFVGDGIPIMYYGQEQGYEGGSDPSNREALWLSGYATGKPLVAHAKSLNVARKLAIAGNASFLSGEATWIPQSDPSSIMLSKPPMLSLFTNIGTASSRQPTWTIPARLYPVNSTLVDTLSCRKVAVNGTGGDTSVTAVQGLPQVLIPLSMLTAQAGLCPSLVTSAQSAAPPSHRISLSLLVSTLSILAYSLEL